jgi:two-component sensor histidine kinase
VSWGFGDLLDEAETIIGELVVNAVQHGSRDAARTSWRDGHSTGPIPVRGRGYPQAWARNSWANQDSWPSQPDQGAATEILKLCLLRRIGELMLAVIDASDDAPNPRQPDWIRESGRGLQIVDALSTVWGWSPIDGHGKAVWAVLPVDFF